MVHKLQQAHYINRWSLHQFLCLLCKLSPFLFSFFHIYICNIWSKNTQMMKKKKTVISEPYPPASPPPPPPHSMSFLLSVACLHVLWCSRAKHLCVCVCKGQLRDYVKAKFKIINRQSQPPPTPKKAKIFHLRQNYISWAVWKVIRQKLIRSCNVKKFLYLLIVRCLFCKSLCW